MTSLINSCYMNPVCDLFRCRHIAANSISVCWMWLMLTVPPRCRQMVDPAPSLPNDFHPHHGAVTFTRNSQAQQRHQEPTSTAFSLFHPENRKRSWATRRWRACSFLQEAPPKKWGEFTGDLHNSVGLTCTFIQRQAPESCIYTPPPHAR